jgi:predicted permease
MSRPQPGPPRLAEWLVRVCVRDDRWRAVTIGDLREELARVARAAGSTRAALWYWRQALALTIRAAAVAAAAPFRPHGDGLMRSLLTETRLAIRSLRRQPLVTAIVIGTLALGLGANAATFGMIDALLLRPFAIPDVDRLVVISESSPDDPFPQHAVSPAAFLDFRRQTDSLRRVAALDWWDVNLAGGDEPERVQGTLVTSDFFPLMGVMPARGRFIQPPDEVHGAHRQVVLSDGMWHRRFAAAPDVVGRAILIDGEPHEVVGIAPPGFDFPNATEIWGALAFDAETGTVRDRRWLTVVGELVPGRTRDDVASEVAVIYERMRQAHPDATRHHAAVVHTFTAAMVDVGMPQVLALWQAAALLVLLIGCANVASLLLARGADRQRELAVRAAIGAGRGRIIRGLLVESGVLALVSVPAALGVARAVFAGVRASMPAELVRFLPGWHQMGIDSRVIAFTFAAALGTAALFGILPALQASRPSLTGALTDGGRTGTAGRGRSRLRRGLVVAEIALALPLLAAAGLAAIGSHRFANGPQGYEPSGLLQMRTFLPDAAYADADARRQFTERLLEAVAGVAGVQEAATANVLPASAGGNLRREIVVEGRPLDPDVRQLANARAVSPGFFETMRIPLVEGRTIVAADREDTQPVAVVSRALARRYFPDGSPIGQRIRIGEDETWVTVIGVSGDVVHDWFLYREEPTSYVPVSQGPSAYVNVVARTAGDPMSLAPALRRALWTVDSTQPAFDVMTLEAAIHQRTTGLRFISRLMAGFGGLALVLAAVGIYGVVAHQVAQRRHEIGVRMALGASSASVLRQTIGQSARMTLLGIAIGLALGVALARVMESALFGVVAVEPALLAAIAATFAVVALLASLLPARQASRVDPVEALRLE